MDEGYIKFNCVWTEGPPLPEEEVREINGWRQRLYEAGLIGAYPDGIGYGNISCRRDKGMLLISGSATGNLRELGPEHYTLVTGIHIDQNTVFCKGPIQASSETMSHAVIYQSLPQVKAVMHVHSLPLWEQLLKTLPSTSASVPYGTPEMAREIRRLLKDPVILRERIFAMAGHREGVIAFGEDFSSAYRALS
jgi:ribulose-5-phosphate 4-epimerase/fuculose-1-phosphate aldolase